MGELAWRRAHGCAGCPSWRAGRARVLLSVPSASPGRQPAPCPGCCALTGRPGWAHSGSAPLLQASGRTDSISDVSPSCHPGPRTPEKRSGYGSSTNQARPYFSPFKTAHAPKAPSNAPKVLHPLTRDPSSSALPHETGQSTAHLPRPRGLCTCLSSVQAGGPATLIRAPASVRTFLSLPSPSPSLPPLPQRAPGRTDPRTQCN